MPRKKTYGSPGAGFNQPAVKIIANEPSSSLSKALANSKHQVDAAKQK
jgi:hypothetical protein